MGIRVRQALLGASREEMKSSEALESWISKMSGRRGSAAALRSGSCVPLVLF